MLRTTGRSAILLATFVVLAAALLLGVSIAAATGSAAHQLRQSLGGYFRISPDQQRMAPGQVDDPLVEQVRSVAELKAVNAMDLQYLLAPDLMLTPGRFTGQGDPKAQLTRVLGNTDSSLHEYFALDLFLLTQGRHVQPTDRGQALISAPLAQANRLALGDRIRLLAESDGSDGRAVWFTIAGIFEERHPSPVDSSAAEPDLPANFVFIDQASSQAIGQALRGDRSTRYSAGAMFYVADPDRLERTVAEVRQLPLDWDALELTVNNGAYRASVAPLHRLSSLAVSAVAVVAALGASLLALLLAMWERDRTHEVAVLLSLGVRKSSIWWQHLLESSIVFLVAFALATAAVWPVSGQLGQSLLTQTTKTSAAVPPPSAGPDVDPLAVPVPEVVLDSTLGPVAIAVTGLTGLGLCGVAVSVAFLAIARRRPKDLLTQME